MWVKIPVCLGVILQGTPTFINRQPEHQQLREVPCELHNQSLVMHALLPKQPVNQRNNKPNEYQTLQNLGHLLNLERCQKYSLLMTNWAILWILSTRITHLKIWKRALLSIEISNFRCIATSLPPQQVTLRGKCCMWSRLWEFGGWMWCILQRKTRPA